MAGGGKLVRSGGKLVRSGGKLLKSADGDVCPPYSLLACPDSTPTDLTLPDSHNPDGATTGDTVKIGDVCYVLGCRTCTGTPVDTDASKKSGCGDGDCGGGLLALNPCCGITARFGISSGGDFSTGDTVTDGIECWTVGTVTGGLTEIDPGTLTATSGCDDPGCPGCCDVCPEDAPTAVVLSFHVKQVRRLASDPPDCTSGTLIGEGDVVAGFTTLAPTFPCEWRYTSLISDSSGLAPTPPIAPTDSWPFEIDPAVDGNYCNYLIDGLAVSDGGGIGGGGTGGQPTPPGTYTGGTFSVLDPGDPTYQIVTCYSAVVVS